MLRSDVGPPPRRIRPAPGNHDGATGSQGAYLDYFGAAAVNEDGDPWYAYDLGTWRIIVLDSDCAAAGGCGPDSRPGPWLADELAATTARCTLAIWHHPRFRSGFHGDDVIVQPFWDALYAAGADVIVNGHDHDYERFAPLSPDGDEDRERGIRQFVVGTGGARCATSRPPDPTASCVWPRPRGSSPSPSRTAATSGRGSRSTGGEVADRGSASCH